MHMIKSLKIPFLLKASSLSLFLDNYFKLQQIKQSLIYLSHNLNFDSNLKKLLREFYYWIYQLEITLVTIFLMHLDNITFLADNLLFKNTESKDLYYFLQDLHELITFNYKYVCINWRQISKLASFSRNISSKLLSILGNFNQNDNEIQLINKTLTKLSYMKQIISSWEESFTLNDEYQVYNLVYSCFMQSLDFVSSIQSQVENQDFYCLDIFVIHSDLSFIILIIQNFLNKYISNKKQAKHFTKFLKYTKTIIKYFQYTNKINNIEFIHNNLQNIFHIFSVIKVQLVKCFPSDISENIKYNINDTNQNDNLFLEIQNFLKGILLFEKQLTPIPPMHCYDFNNSKSSDDVSFFYEVNGVLPINQFKAFVCKFQLDSIKSTFCDKIKIKDILFIDFQKSLFSQIIILVKYFFKLRYSNNFSIQTSKGIEILLNNDNIIHCYNLIMKHITLFNDCSKNSGDKTYFATKLKEIGLENKHDDIAIQQLIIAHILQELYAIPSTMFSSQNNTLTHSKMSKLFFKSIINLFDSYINQIKERASSNLIIFADEKLFLIIKRGFVYSKIIECLVFLHHKIVNKFTEVIPYLKYNTVEFFQKMTSGLNFEIQCQYLSENIKLLLNSHILTNELDGMKHEEILFQLHLIRVLLHTIILDKNHKIILENIEPQFDSIFNYLKIQIKQSMHITDLAFPQSNNFWNDANEIIFFVNVINISYNLNIKLELLNNILNAKLFQLSSFIQYLLPTGTNKLNFETKLSMSTIEKNRSSIFYQVFSSNEYEMILNSQNEFKEFQSLRKSQKIKIIKIQQTIFSRLLTLIANGNENIQIDINFIAKNVLDQSKSIIIPTLSGKSFNNFRIHNFGRENIYLSTSYIHKIHYIFNLSEILIQFLKINAKINLKSKNIDIHSNDFMKKINNIENQKFITLRSMVTQIISPNSSNTSDLLKFILSSPENNLELIAFLNLNLSWILNNFEFQIFDVNIKNFEKIYFGKEIYQYFQFRYNNDSFNADILENIKSKIQNAKIKYLNYKSAYALNLLAIIRSKFFPYLYNISPINLNDISELKIREFKILFDNILDQLENIHKLPMLLSNLTPSQQVNQQLLLIFLIHYTLNNFNESNPQDLPDISYPSLILTFNFLKNEKIDKIFNLMKTKCYNFRADLDCLINQNAMFIKFLARFHLFIQLSQHILLLLPTKSPFCNINDKSFQELTKQFSLKELDQLIKDLTCSISLNTDKIELCDKLSQEQRAYQLLIISHLTNFLYNKIIKQESIKQKSKSSSSKEIIYHTIKENFPHQEIIKYFIIMVQLSLSNRYQLYQLNFNEAFSLFQSSYMDLFETAKQIHNLLKITSNSEFFEQLIIKLITIVPQFIPSFIYVYDFIIQHISKSYKNIKLTINKILKYLSRFTLYNMYSEDNAQNNLRTNFSKLLEVIFAIGSLIFNQSKNDLIDSLGSTVYSIQLFDIDAAYFNFIKLKSISCSLSNQFEYKSLNEILTNSDDIHIILLELYQSYPKFTLDLNKQKYLQSFGGKILNILIPMLNDPFSFVSSYRIDDYNTFVSEIIQNCSEEKFDYFQLRTIINNDKNRHLFSIVGFFSLLQAIILNNLSYSNQKECFDILFSICSPMTQLTDLIPMTQNKSVFYETEINNVLQRLSKNYQRMILNTANEHGTFIYIINHDQAHVDELKFKFATLLLNFTVFTSTALFTLIAFDIIDISKFFLLNQIENYKLIKQQLNKSSLAIFKLNCNQTFNEILYSTLQNLFQDTDSLFDLVKSKNAKNINQEVLQQIIGINKLLLQIPIAISNIHCGPILNPDIISSEMLYKSFFYPLIPSKPDILLHELIHNIPQITDQNQYLSRLNSYINDLKHKIDNILFYIYGETFLTNKEIVEIANQACITLNKFLKHILFFSSTIYDFLSYNKITICVESASCIFQKMIQIIYNIFLQKNQQQEDNFKLLSEKLFNFLYSSLEAAQKSKSIELNSQENSNLIKRITIPFDKLKELYDSLKQSCNNILLSQWSRKIFDIESDCIMAIISCAKTFIKQPEKAFQLESLISLIDMILLESKYTEKKIEIIEFPKPYLNESFSQKDIVQSIIINTAEKLINIFSQYINAVKLSLSQKSNQITKHERILLETLEKLTSTCNSIISQVKLVKEIILITDPPYSYSYRKTDQPYIITKQISYKESLLRRLELESSVEKIKMRIKVIERSIQSPD